MVTVILSPELGEKVMLGVRQGKPFRCKDGVFKHCEDNPSVIVNNEGEGIVGFVSKDCADLWLRTVVPFDANPQLLKHCLEYVINEKENKEGWNIKSKSIYSLFCMNIWA